MNNSYMGIVAALLVASIAMVLPVSNSVLAQHPDNSTSMSAMTMNETVVAEGNAVAVGGGNMTVQHYTFAPQTVEINAGDSVTWYSPTEFNELHTVTFVQNPMLMSDIILPFSIQDADSSKVLPPFNFGEPIIMDMPNGTAIVALNKAAFYPSVSNTGGDAIQYFNETAIQYTMNGTEGVLNSGIIQQPFPEIPDAPANMTNGEPLAEEMPIGPPFPFVELFTVTFENEGTYPYFCALHPWMTGEVIVNGQNHTGVS